MREWVVGVAQMWMWLTVQCAVVAVLLSISDDLSRSGREMVDGGVDDRCEKGSSSVGGHMLVVSGIVWSNLLNKYVVYCMKYKFTED